MRYLANAFSIGMIDDDHATLTVKRLDLEQARDYVREGFESCVGHADTALLLTEMLGVPVELRRVSTSFQRGAVMLVAQYNGPRLPEGATSLPEGAKIRWVLVTYTE